MYISCTSSSVDITFLSTKLLCDRYIISYIQIHTYKYVVKNNKIGTQLQDYLLNGPHSLGHLVCNLFPLGMRKQFVQKKHSFDKKKEEIEFFNKYVKPTQI